MPMNTKLVGRSYPATRYTVTAAATKAYAHATNETSPRYLEGDLVAPPIFPVVYHPRALGQAIGDPELGIDFKRALELAPSSALAHQWYAELPVGDRAPRHRDRSHA